MQMRLQYLQSMNCIKKIVRKLLAVIARSPVTNVLICILIYIFSLLDRNRPSAQVPRRVR
jgi:hypothetical protein